MAGPGGNGSGTRATIAVVDDDVGVCRALARLLRTAGFEVVTYRSAEEFLALGWPAELDCLVLDVYLGGMTGFDLRAALLARGSSPPTVFLTAHDEWHGDVPCLRKPVEDTTLLDTIDLLIQSRAPRTSPGPDDGRKDASVSTR
jgi:FixJ family two-component response regulator